MAGGCSEVVQHESSISACDLAIEIENPGGALHAQPCENDGDCLYGRCHQSPNIGDIKFCTKPCDCGPGSSCQDEDGAGLSYVCQRFSDAFDETETMPAFCTQGCDAVADCPAGYDACVVVTGSRRVCMAKAVRGNND